MWSRKDTIVAACAVYECGLFYFLSVLLACLWAADWRHDSASENWLVRFAAVANCIFIFLRAPRRESREKCTVYSVLQSFFDTRKRNSWEGLSCACEKVSSAPGFHFLLVCLWLEFNANLANCEFSCIFLHFSSSSLFTGLICDVQGTTSGHGRYGEQERWRWEHGERDERWEWRGGSLVAGYRAEFSRGSSHVSSVRTEEDYLVGGGEDVWWVDELCCWMVLIDWLIGRLTEIRLIDWLIDCLIDWSLCFYSRCTLHFFLAFVYRSKRTNCTVHQNSDRKNSHTETGL